tara:strand:- start:1847 stop:2686 length:840 start_codon:yes stop_codon:yes gene_type:complete
MMQFKAHLKKMRVENGTPIKYWLLTQKGEVLVNDFIGKNLMLEYTGVINCVVCSRLTKKSFGNGSCYPCFINAPENSECIIRPELCLGHEGKGRDPVWEMENHVVPHTVYLALTSGIKVGITRKGNEFTRWIDQGAWKSIKFAEVPDRYTSGIVEVELKNYISDKTHWQKMLKDDRNEEINLLEAKDDLISYLPDSLQDFVSDEDDIYEFHYPVETYPTKVKSLNFDKTPTIEGKLEGIRGQYLIFEDGKVINLRKFTGYNICLTVQDSVAKTVQKTLF